MIPKCYDHSFHGVRLDPYRILSVYRITNPAQQHAIKKLLRAGQGENSYETDITEAINSLSRLKEMLKEDAEGRNTIKPAELPR